MSEILNERDDRHRVLGASYQGLIRIHARMVAEHKSLNSVVDEAYAVIPTTSAEVDPLLCNKK